jgi:hypothetical protein
MKAKEAASATSKGTLKDRVRSGETCKAAPNDNCGGIRHQTCNFIKRCAANHPFFGIGCALRLLHKFSCDGHPSPRAHVVTLFHGLLHGLCGM